MRLKNFAFAILSAFALAALFMTAQSAHAEPFQQIEKGKNFDREFVGLDESGARIYKWTSHPERILDTYLWDGTPVWKDYRLTETPTHVFVETANSGSIAFDRQACSFDFYESGYITGGQPKVSNISWLVKGKPAASSAWSNVNAVNGAPCEVWTNATESAVRITGQKADALGTFQIILDYAPGTGFKETMRAYNNNESWNNHHIGFAESFDVPTVIKFGNAQYDLSQYNGTVLNRSWIENNKAKLLTLADSAYYDIGIGFSSLDTIQISYQNGQARLTLNYLYTNSIVPYQQWFEVDPTFSSDNPTVDGQVYTTTVASTACSTTVAAKVTTGTTMLGSNIQASTSNAECYFAFSEWDISSIPTGRTIQQATYLFEINATINARNCAYIGMTARPSTATNQQILNSIQGYDDPIISGNSICTSTGSKSIDLGSNGTEYISDQLSSGWAAIGMRFQNMTRDASVHSIAYETEENTSANPPPTLQIIYADFPPPDAVTDLAVTQITTQEFLLTWTEPGLNGDTLLQYMVNYSSPMGDPTTVLAYTGDTATSYTATILGGGSLSFRVSAVTASGSNSSGNIANIEAISFTIGSINVTATNPDQTGIQFERDDLNDTATFLNVTYLDTYDLACDFAYEFAGTNTTYTGLQNTTVNDDYVESSFLLLNSDNEVIHVTCWDQNSNDTGYYALTQSSFPLLQQIENFRNGEYGTSGMFGLIDFITLIVVILSMIGFNRVDETVGAIFNVFFLGALWYFEIIEPISLLFGFLAVAVMLVIAKNRGE